MNLISWILTSKALITPQNIPKTEAPIINAGATDELKNVVDVILDVS